MSAVLAFLAPRRRTPTGRSFPATDLGPVETIPACAAEGVERRQFGQRETPPPAAPVMRWRWRGRVCTPAGTMLGEEWGCVTQADVFNALRDLIAEWAGIEPADVTTYEGADVFRFGDELLGTFTIEHYREPAPPPRPAPARCTMKVAF